MGIYLKQVCTKAMHCQNCMLNLHTVLAVLSTPKLYAIDQEKIERSEPHLLDLDSDLEMTRNLQEQVAQELVAHLKLVVVVLVAPPQLKRLYHLCLVQGNL